MILSYLRLVSIGGFLPETRIATLPSKWSLAPAVQHIPF